MSAPAPHVLFAGRVGVRRAAEEAGIQWTALGIFGAAVVVAVVPHLAAIAVSLASGLHGLLLVLLVALLYRQARARWLPAGEICLVRDEVRVRRKGRPTLVFPVRGICGWATQPGSTLVLEVQGGLMLTVAVQGREREQILLALGMDAGRLSRVTLLDGRELREGMVGPLLLAAFGLVPSVSYAAPTIMFVIGGMDWLASLMAFVLVRRVEVSATVGLDGVTIQRGARRRFVSFKGSDDVRQTSDGIVLTRLGFGIDLLRRDEHAGEERRRDLVLRIRAALDARKMREGTPDKVRFLAREGRGVAAWREAMRGLAGSADGYRVATMARDEMAVVLDDPTASAEHRLGAALALAEATDPDVVRRLRVVADTCANQRMRIALEGIAAATPDEAAIEEALAEEAVPSPRGAAGRR